MSAEPRPLEGVRICYVSNTAFSGATRTLKQAASAAAAGARVTFVGYANDIPQAIADSPFPVVAVVPPELPAMRSSHFRFWPLRVLENRMVNVPAYEAAVRRYERYLHFDRRSHPRLIDAVIAAEPDIIQAVDLPVLDAACAARDRTGSRLVYDTHEYWRGFLANQDSGARREEAAAMLEGEARLIRDVSLVLSVSEPMADRLVTDHGIARPLTILNSPTAKLDTTGNVHSPVRLVFHGGLSADRNVDGLIRALALMRSGATLDIHGSGRTVSEQDLRSLVDGLGLSGRVRLHGRFDYDRVLEVIGDYDVGVLAAKVTEENFEIALPNKLFDCMCAGLAVAFSDSEGIRSVLDHVPFGMTLDPSSPETIAAALDGLLADPERIARMKQAAVDAAPCYWWPEQGSKLVEALAGMLSRD